MTFKPDKVQTLFRRILFQYWYFSQPPWDTGISPPELIEFIEKHPPGRAIDIGCGTGTNVITLAKAGWQVTGVDFAPRAIKLARQKIKRTGVKAELFIRDATKLTRIHGPFDLALDIGCFHGFSKEDQEKYLDELDRILAPGGFWLLYGFLKLGTPPSGTGLDEADLSHIATRLTLLSRRDGHDDKRNRVSAWLLYQKQP
ncbi:MAG: class I SAM-dependent methyltransferase [Chloroflexi bacterium]|nr:class I SAM-dependent methyltransferase [Chloroflexota bacterium]